MRAKTASSICQKRRVTLGCLSPNRCPAYGSLAPRRFVMIGYLSPKRLVPAGKRCDEGADFDELQAFAAPEHFPFTQTSRPPLAMGEKANFCVPDPRHGEAA